MYIVFNHRSDVFCIFVFRNAVEELSDIFSDCAGNFYINDKSTGSVVGQQPFGGSRLSGILNYNTMQWYRFTKAITQNLNVHTNLGLK